MGHLGHSKTADSSAGLHPSQFWNLLRGYLRLSDSSDANSPAKEVFVKALLNPLAWCAGGALLALVIIGLEVLDLGVPRFLVAILIASIAIIGVLLLRAEWHLLKRRPGS